MSGLSHATEIMFAVARLERPRERAASPEVYRISIGMAPIAIASARICGKQAENRDAAMPGRGTAEALPGIPIDKAWTQRIMFERFAANMAGCRQQIQREECAPMTGSEVSYRAACPCILRM